MKRTFYILVILLISGLSVHVYRYYRDLEPAPQVVEPEVVIEIQEPLPEPEKKFGIVVDSMVVIEDRVRRNQNISDILSDYNVSNEKIYELSKASKGVFDVRKLVVRKPYTLICDPDSLTTAKYFIYQPNPVDYVVFDLSDSVTVEARKKETIVEEREISGVISSSLAETMSDLNLSPMLTNEFADVFAWQIDFFRLYPGDKFKIIYEEEMVEGESIGIRKIIGGYFEHNNHPYYAVYYNQGDGEDYFDEEGKSLRKALLKYPLKFSRISSRYTGRRYHPVLKRYKAHRGTDFVAPRGTPIRTVGDGIVEEARYGKYNGYFIKIRHNSNYTTQYLHMSGFAKGVKTGTKVKQGQTIGYVGKTGLATGNHLCYRFWKNGVQVDALKVEIPPSNPIQEENMPAYIPVRDEMMKRLDRIQFSEDVLIARSR